MAKKKSTQKSNNADQQNPEDEKQQNPGNDKFQNQEQEKTKAPTRPPAVEDPVEKMRNLKNLNSMLLKETLERRQQVESLVKAKEALENELARHGVEKSDLEADLTRKSDEVLSSAIEKGLFSTYTRTQLKEIGIEIDDLRSVKENEISVLKDEVKMLLGNLENERERLSRDLRERDLIKNDLESRVQEANRFKERLHEMEKKERDLKKEILEQKLEYEALMESRIERDQYLESTKEEKDLIESKFDDAMKEIDYLKGEIEAAVRGKKEIEKERKGQKVKMLELEKEVEKLNEIVSLMQNEDRVLSGRILEMEKSYLDAKEEGEGMLVEINDLICEKKEKEISFERLMEEKEDIARRLEKAMMEIYAKEEEIDNLRREINEVGKKISMKDNEIVEVRKENDKLMKDVLALKESGKDQEEKFKQLLKETEKALDRVTLERDDAQKVLNEVKTKGLCLSSKLTKMEKEMEEKANLLATFSKENETMIEENEKMENMIKWLTNDKVFLENNLLKAKQEVNDLKARMETVGFNSSKTLSLLKSTSAMICKSEDDEVASGEKLGDENDDAYIAELEAIKNAFMKKEKNLEEMKRKMELLQSSVVEAHKKKSFWAALSSATTIFAAASVAYVVRGH